MPEIPELEAIRAYFTGQLSGHAIATVETKPSAVFRVPAADLKARLPGEVFGPVLRHGKFVLFPFASGRVLAINPMLTGRFQYVPASTRKHARTYLWMDIEGGQQFRYVDERVMGKVYFVDHESLGAIPGWDTNGPDLLDTSLTEDRWLQLIKKYRGRIKQILVNAEFVQGIGNAYGDEILWEAQINPYANRTELSEEDLRRLYRAAHAVTEWATPLVASKMVRDGVLDYEERRDFMRVHRLGGNACPRCGATITEITANQRVTSFCRTCQPGFVH